MSAIAGLLRFDRHPVSRPELEQVASALRAHGPDRSRVVVNGSIGFVHLLMRMTTEERQSDYQPYSWTERITDHGRHAARQSR